jgi:hypothetical protein
MLEDIRKDIQWAVDRLYNTKAEGENFLAIGAVIKRLEETLKMIDAEIAGYDTEAEELLMEDIEEHIQREFRGNRDLTNQEPGKEG